MENRNKSSAEADSLRHKAEVKLNKLQPQKSAVFSEADLLKVIHELKVHQVEHEMLNEELQLSRSKAEEAVEKFTELNDFSPSGYFTLDQPGIISALNPSGASLLGKEQLELIGNDFRLFISNNSQQIVNVFLHKIFTSNSKQTCVAELTNVNKPSIFVHLEGKVIDDKPKCLIIAVDITEHIMIADQIRESESKYRTLVDEVNDGFYISDSKGVLSFANLAMARILGFNHPDEIIGHRFIEFLPVEKAGELAEKFRYAMSSGINSDSIETKVRRQDGTYAFIEIRPRVIVEGEILKSNQGIIRDITRNKLAEKELQDKESLYRTLFENANDAIFTIRKDKFIDCNLMAISMFGFETKEDIKGHHPWEFSPAQQPDGRNSVESALEKIESAMEGNPQRFHWKHETKNRKSFDVEVSLNLVKFEDTTLIQSIVRDISESKQAEEALKISESNYRNLFENSVMAVSQVSIDGYLIHANDAYAQMYGYANQKELFSEMYDVGRFYAHPDMRNEVHQLLNENGIMEPREMEVVRRDGTHFFILVGARVLHDLNGNVYGYQAEHVDITKRKKAENLLMQSEARLSAFMEHVPALILIKDQHLRPVYANNKFRELFPFEEWFGKTPGELFPPEIANSMIENDLEAINKGFNSYEETWTDKASVLHIYSTQKFRINIPESEPFLGAIITEITDRKKAEESLRENEKNLRELIATKDKFFSIIAHDLKSPFNSILGFSELLKEDAKDLNIADIEHYAGIINASARHTFELLENLLTWARMQRGTVSFEPRSIFLDQLILQEFDFMKNNAIHKNINLLSHVTKNFIVVADDNMLSNILRNLITNAIKFTHKNGMVQIAVQIQDDYVRISVTDNGIGLKPERIDQLFKIETSFTTRGTENEKGTGLGLLLCKEFVEKHGGKIWVESEVANLTTGLTDSRAGKAGGSTFYFTIPNNNES